MLSGQLHVATNNNAIYIKRPTSVTMQEQQSTMKLQQQQQQQQQQQGSSNNNDANKCLIIAECTYKNCCLNNIETQQQQQAQQQQRRRNQRTMTNSTELLQEQQQQYVDLEINTIDVATNNKLCEDISKNSINEVTPATILPTPIQFAQNNFNIKNSNNNLDAIATLPRPLCHRDNDMSAMNVATVNLTPAPLPDMSDATTATPTSTRSMVTRRYHRRIPRYFTMHEHPLQNNATNNKNKKQNVVNRSVSGNNNNNNKKSTCQCPVQHVPISASSFHMGQTPYLSALNNKVDTHEASYNSSPASNHCTRSTQRGRPMNESSISSQQLNTQTRHNTNNLAQYCAHDSKISTISNQVQAEHNQPAQQSTDVATAYAHTTHNAVTSTPVLPLIAHDDCAPVLLGRVRESRKPTCNNERLRSISNSSSRHGYQAQNTENDATTSTAFFLSGKVSYQQCK